jgi:DUF1680 family protein
LNHRSDGIRRRLFIKAALASLALDATAESAGFQDSLAPLPLNKVKAGGLIGDRIQAICRGNLLKLDIDGDFLAPFLDKDHSWRVPGGFVGLGTTTDALVRFAYYTGDPELLALKQRALKGIARAQESDGYIGINPPARRIREVWDVHELNYLVYGLVTDYRLFGSEKSLAIARRAADYMVDRMSGKMPRAVNDSEIHMALVITGFDRTMLAIYAATGDRRYLDILRDVGLAAWDLDIVEGRKKPYYGHMYAFLARSLAQLELYHRTGDKRLLNQTMKAVDFLRKRNGLLVTGSGNNIECWSSDQSSTGESTETCATAYLIRILDQLQRMYADPGLGDMMERAIYNALFAAMSPDGRRLRYWTPFEGPRQFYGHDFMCCPGNLRRIVSELPGMIYYRQARGGITVNLYTASTATIGVPHAGDVTVRQETDYPASGSVILQIDPSQPGVSFPVSLRIPRWCRNASISVNGKPVPVNGPGYAEIRRKWRLGDRIELSLDMPWRFVRGAQTQEGRAAVLRGPLLYCLNPDLNPAIGGLDLKQIVLDSDNQPRKHGTACEIGAWTSLREGPPDLKLVLTEFPDPGGRATYFVARRDAGLVPDELLQTHDEQTSQRF